MSLFPFYGEKKEEVVTELPMYKEIEWNYTDNKPVFIDGKPKWVFGKEAVKTWCYKTLQVNRYKLEMYSWNYGVEFENLIGRHYSKQLVTSELIRYVKEALMINPYIEGVNDIKIDFNEGYLTVSCVINTVYGDTEVSVNV